MTMPLCKDCRWFVESPIGDGDCRSPKNVEKLDGYYLGRYLVRGVAPHFSYKMDSCAIQRASGWFDALTLGRCGRAGRWFEQALQNDTEKTEIQSS